MAAEPAAAAAEPPAPPEAARVRRGPRLRADVVNYVDGGQITYYHTSGQFTATCKNAAHGDVF